MSQRGLLIWTAILAGLITAVILLDHGVVSIRPHSLDLGLVGALELICLSVGQLLLGRLRTIQAVLHQPLERLVFCSVVGTGIVGSWILLGAFLFGVSPVSLAASLAPLVILTGVRLVEVTRSLQLASRQLFTQAGPAVLAVFGLVVGFMFLQSLAPPTDWDSLVYHLQVPRQWLEQGRMYLPEDNFHVAFVGLIHMLYLPLLAFGSPAGPSILSAMYGVLLSCAVFSFCLRFFSRTTARLSLLTMWGTTSLLLVAVTPRLDATLVLFLFLAHYLLVIGLTNVSAKQLFWLAGLMLGFAAGVKYSALAYAVALVPLVPFVVSRERKTVGSSIRILGILAVLLLCGAGPWMAKNQVLLDAPFYPFLTDRMLQPWLADVASSEKIPAGVDPLVFKSYGQAREKFNLADFFLSPGRITVEPEGLLYFTSPVLLLAFLAVLFLRDRIVIALLGPAILYMTLVISLFPAMNIRYLLPVVPPLTIIGVETGIRVIDRFSWKPFRQSARGVIAALGIAPMLFCTAVVITELKTVGYALGRVTKEEYLASYPLAGFRSYWSHVRYANENYDGRSRTLMLFEARGYYFDVAVLQDNVMTNWPLLVGIGATENCLRGMNIKHVIVASEAFSYFQDRGMDTEPLRWDLFPAFVQRCLTVTHEAPGITAYRVGHR